MCCKPGRSRRSWRISAIAFVATAEIRAELGDEFCWEEAIISIAGKIHFWKCNGLGECPARSGQVMGSLSFMRVTDAANPPEGKLVPPCGE